MYSILTGSVKMNSIFGALLISVNPEMMPSWQKTLKSLEQNQNFVGSY